MGRGRGVAKAEKGEEKDDEQPGVAAATEQSSCGLHEQASGSFSRQSTEATDVEKLGVWMSESGDWFSGGTFSRASTEGLSIPSGAFSRQGSGGLTGAFSRQSTEEVAGCVGGVAGSLGVVGRRSVEEVMPPAVARSRQGIETASGPVGPSSGPSAEGVVGPAAAVGRAGLEQIPVPPSALDWESARVVGRRSLEGGAGPADHLGRPSAVGGEAWGDRQQPQPATDVQQQRVRGGGEAPGPPRPAQGRGAVVVEGRRYPPPAPMESIFRKTQLCRFFAAGRCRMGSQCRFAHGAEELQAKPDLWRTKLCPNIMGAVPCPAADRCTYAHSLDQLRDVQRRWEEANARHEPPQEPATASGASSSAAAPRERPSPESVASGASASAAIPAARPSPEPATSGASAAWAAAPAAQQAARREASAEAESGDLIRGEGPTVAAAAGRTPPVEEGAEDLGPPLPVSAHRFASEPAGMPFSQNLRVQNTFLTFEAYDMESRPIRRTLSAPERIGEAHGSANVGGTSQ